MLGKQQMYAKGLISSPNLSNTDLVTEAKAALRSMKVQLLQGQLQLSTGTATAYTQFEAARAQLDEGWAQYQSGQEQLDASRTEYETQKADAEQKLAEGQQQINDAEEKIADIQNGEWYVLDRGSTLSLVTLEQYADRMAAIARVFPVFFFLVAALVASTTMTRMVDENRLQMGTLKALGYSNTSIAGKVLTLWHCRQRSGQHRGHCRGLCGVPHHLLVRLPHHDVLPPHLYPALLPGPGTGQHGPQRSGHRPCHPAGLPRQPQGKIRRPAAAPCACSGQAHPP